MRFHRLLKVFLSKHPLVLTMVLSPGVCGAESVLVRDEQGLADMLGASGWRESGEVAAPASGLLFDNPGRRKSAEWHRGGHRVTGFGPSPVTGQSEDFFDSDVESNFDSEDDRSDGPNGIAWSTSPAKMTADQLTITGTYVHAGEDETPDGEKPSGAAGAVSVDSKLPFRGEIRLHGELALSTFDADGTADYLKGERGSALAAGISYAPQTSGLSRVQIEAGFRQVGPGFRSVTNMSLKDDHRRTHIGGRFIRNSLSLQGEISRTIDNYSEQPALETDSFRFRADYAPSSAGADDRGASVFRNPRFSFGFSREHTEDTGGEPQRWRTDRENSQIELSAAFAPGPANWSLAHTVSRQEDHTDFQLDVLTRKSRLQIALPLNERAQLSSTLEQSEKEYENGYELDETRAALRLGLSGGNAVKSSLSLTSEQTHSSDGAIDQSRVSASVRVDKPLPALPGDPKLSLDGGYQITASRGGRDSGYRIFLGLELKLGTG